MDYHIFARLNIYKSLTSLFSIFQQLTYCPAEKLLVENEPNSKLLHAIKRLQIYIQVGKKIESF